MKFQLDQLSPLKLAFLCGALSAFLNLSGAMYFPGTIFSLVFSVLNFLWLSPLAFVTFLHGKYYGILAVSIVIILEAALTNISAPLISGVLSCLPVIYCASILKQKAPRAQVNPIRLGKAFSQLCFFYLIILVISLILFLDQSLIETTVQRLLQASKYSETIQLPPTFMVLFPSLICCSAIIIVIGNILFSLKIIKYFQTDNIPLPPLYDWRIPEYWDTVFIAGVLLILTGHEMSAFIGKNGLLLSCLPLYVYGLSIVDDVLSQFENSKLWVVFITIISVFLLWPAMLIILLGLLQPILRIKKPG